MDPTDPLDTVDSNEGRVSLFPRLERLILVSVPALIVIFYLWTVLTNGPCPTAPSRLFYPELAAAFLQGQTYLDVTPDPHLLALSDPYNPDLNEHYRLHDASLYHGKYYLYFGPAPAALLFTPFRLLTGLNFPQLLAVFVFSSAGYLFSVILFRVLVRDYFPQTPLWLRLAAVASLGLANACPFLLRRPDVYETAISCAYCFLQLAFLCFYRALGDPRQMLPRLVLVSFCLGAAVASRYNYLFTIGVFLVFLICLRHFGSAPSWRIFLALIPAGIVGGLLAWYNYARFGNPFDFGQQYQLAGVEVSKLHFTRLVNIPTDIGYYFFQPPQITSEFPFVQIPTPLHVHFDPNGHTPFYGLEKIAGLFVISPLSLFALAIPLLFFGTDSGAEREKRQPLRLTLGFIAITTIAVMAPVLCISGTTMRYLVDFAPDFIFLGGIVMCHFISFPPRSPLLGWVRRDLFLLVLFIGCWNGLMLSFSGYYDWLKIYNPQTYAEISHLFAPVEWILHGAASLSFR